MDLVTCRNDGEGDLPQTVLAPWALVPDMPNPISLALLVMALAAAPGDALPAEMRRLVQARYRELAQPGTLDGPEQP